MHITTLTLDVADLSAADLFYKALGISSRVRCRESDAASTGFRGFHISLIVPTPGDVDELFRSAVAAGATEVKPAKKSLWGYGGVVHAPDGSIWKFVSESRKPVPKPSDDPAAGRISDVVLLLGVDDLKASKQFYVERGLRVAKSFGKYVEFDTGGGLVKLALLKRGALAKDAGVSEEGSGSHRIVIGTDGAPFTDPDGFVWDTTR